VLGETDRILLREEVILAVSDLSTIYLSPEGMPASGEKKTFFSVLLTYKEGIYGQ